MNKLLKKVVYFGGAVMAFIAVPPLPWRVRVAYYGFVDKLVNTGLKLLPSVYDMVTADDVKYNMGKTDEDQIIPIKALEIVVKELDRRGVSPGEVAKVYAGLKEKNVPHSKIPYALAESLIDKDTISRLFKHMLAG